MKKILLATRPLVPPWDEASKNFAYFLGKSLRGFAVTLLGSKKPLEGLPDTTVVSPIYSRSHFGLLEKLQFFWYLFQQKNCFDITHYLFTPTKQNSKLIQKYLSPTKGKTLQTVATLRDDLYTEDELRQMLFADKIVVYTDRSKGKLKNLGFTNVERIYPGIDLSLYQKQPKNLAFLQALQLDESHFVVMHPGEYVRLGATDYLTDFCIEYFTEHPDTRIRFVFGNRIKNNADAEKKIQVEKRLRDAGVLEYVRFTNNVPDMATLYNSSDVIAFPVGNLAGKFDVPLVIIEAYACEKPLILSDLEEFEEFSDHSFCVKIERGSIDQLSAAVSRLEAAPEACKTLGTNARSFVEKHFDLTQTVKEYSNLYNTL